MPLPTEQFLKRVALMADAALLCEILDIDSEDLLERFSDLIDEHTEEGLREIFDVDMEVEYDE